MNLIEYADPELMALDVAQKIAGELENVLLGGERATLVVPGGETPAPMFDNLSAADLDWAKVDVLLSDERWLPEVNLRSNTRLVKERLLNGRAAAARFHPFFTGGEDPDAALAEVESGLIPCLPIDVLVLGMGDDMHTASLFPGGDNLARALDPKAPILLSMRAPAAPEPRVTMTARVLNDAVSKHLMITGRPKRNALDRALQLAPEEAPVAAILDNCTVHWAP